MINVREMTEADLPRVRELALQLGYETEVSSLADRFARVQADPKHEAFVAADGEVVVAFIHVRENLVLESRLDAEITGLVVDEARRSEGVGKLLVGRAEQWARKHGYRQIAVRSNVIRERAHRFYEREGFTKRKSQFTLEKPL